MYPSLSIFILNLGYFANVLMGFYILVGVYPTETKAVFNFERFEIIS